MSNVPPSQPPAPRHRHRAAPVAAVVVATLVALVFMALVTLHTPPVRRMVLARVAEALRAQRIGLDAANLRYNLLKLSVAVDDVQVRSEAWPDGPTFATIRHADADLSLRALLHGRYEVQSARIDGLDVHYVVDADGRTNLPSPPERESSSDAPLDYLIDDARIANAVIRYESRPQGLDLRLPVQQLTVRGNAATLRHDVQLAAAGGEVAASGRRVAIDRLDGQVDLGRDDLRIGRLQLVTGAAQADLSGTIQDFSAPTADLAARVAADLAEASRVAGVTAPVGGTLDVDGTARGPFTALDASASIAGRGVRYGTLDGIALDAQARYLAADQRADLSSLRVRAPFGGLDAQGSLALVDSGTTRLAARLLGLDAGQLTRALDTPYVVATRVDGDVAATFPGLDYARATGDATLALAATQRAAAPRVVPVGGRLRARAENGSVRVDSLDLAALGARATGAVGLGRPTDDAATRALDGRVRLAADDLAATLSAAERLLGRRPGTLAPAPTSGALRAEFVLDGSTTAPRALGWVESPSLTVGPITGAFVHADVHYDPSVLRVPRLEAGWQGTAVTADATVGLTGAQALDARLDARGFDVAALLALAGQGDVPASGRVDLQATASGTVASPQARVSLTGTDLQAYGERLGTLRADAGLAGREVVVDSLTLDKPQPDGDGRVTASARYHLNRREAAVNLRSEGLRLVSLDVPGAPAVRGPLAVEAHVRGPLDTAPGHRRRVERELGGRQAAASGQSVRTPTWPTARRTSPPPPTSSRCRPAPTSPCARPMRRSWTRASTGSISLACRSSWRRRSPARCARTSPAPPTWPPRVRGTRRPPWRPSRARGRATPLASTGRRCCATPMPGSPSTRSASPPRTPPCRCRATCRSTPRPRPAPSPWTPAPTSPRSRSTRRPARRSPPPATLRCRGRCAARCRRSTRR